MVKPSSTSIFQLSSHYIPLHDPLKIHWWCHLEALAAPVLETGVLSSWALEYGVAQHVESKQKQLHTNIYLIAYHIWICIYIYIKTVYIAIFIWTIIPYPIWNAVQKPWLMQKSHIWDHLYRSLGCVLWLIGSEIGWHAHYFLGNMLEHIYIYIHNIIYIYNHIYICIHTNIYI